MDDKPHAGRHIGSGYLGKLVPSFAASFHSSFAFLTLNYKNFNSAEGSARETERPKTLVTIILLTIFTNITGNDKP